MRTLTILFLMAATGLAADMKAHRDIAYVKDGDKRQRLDVYAPADGKNHPVIIWIHGGGWRQGDKAGVQRKPQATIGQGFVFVSVNYRFVPQVTLQEMTGDIAKAVKWVHDNVAKYGGSKETLFIAGHSAGAHLAALICTDDRYLKAEGISLANIKGCIPVDTAVYDAARQIKERTAARAAVYAGPFTRIEKTQRELSPVTHVAKGKNIPPFLILHVASRPDSTKQSQLFAKALRAAGVDAKLVPGKDKTHGTINRDLGVPGDPPTKAVFEFLKAKTAKK